MRTVYIRDQTARSVQSDLDLHSLQKLYVPSSVKKEFAYLLKRYHKHNSHIDLKIMHN